MENHLEESIHDYRKLNLQFEVIYQQDDHDALLNFILRNENLINVRYRNTSPFAMALEHNWDDILIAYSKKENLKPGLHDYHASILFDIIANLTDRSELCAHFMELEINPLFEVSDLMNLSHRISFFAVVSSLPELQSMVPALFNKIAEEDRITLFETDEDNKNPFLYSIITGCTENVVFFLENGAIISQKAISKGISMAAISNFPKMLQIICEHVKTFGPKDLLTRSSVIAGTAFVQAAKHHLLQNVHTLLNYVGEINVADPFGNTALHAAASEGHDDMIRYLLESKADIFQRNIRNTDAAEILAISGFSELLDFLPVDLLDYDQHRLLSKISEAGHFILLKSFIAKFNLDVNSCPASACCALQAAVTTDQSKIVRYLLEMKANVNHFYGKGSAIYYAVVSNQVTMADLLLQHGADINEQDTIGDKRSLLMYALKFKHVEMAEFLINRGANLNHRDRLGRTALIYAANQSLLPIGELLLAKGANTHIRDVFPDSVIIHTIKDIFGADAFIYSIKSRNIEFSRLILKNNDPLFKEVSETTTVLDLFSESTVPKQICDRSVILDLYSQGTQPFDQKNCNQHLLELKHLRKVESLLTSSLALELYDPSVSLPCQRISFQGEEFGDRGVPLA